MVAKSTPPAPEQNLLFDPVLVYSTYLGGASSANPPFNLLQVATVILTDPSGNLYVAGSTNSRSFPVTAGVVESNNSQKNLLGFVAKLDPTGHTLLFSSYIDGIQGVTSMALDLNGDIYVSGRTVPAGAGVPVLPIPSGSTPFQSSPRGFGILKLNGTATTVLAATYLGGSGDDSISGIAVEPGTTGSNLFITGETGSNDFPTHSPLQASLGSVSNVFVTVLNPALSTAVYSTYLGQTSSASTGGSHSIAVDTAGDAYVVGSANAGFPTAGSPLQATCPDNCSFIAELNPAGSALLHSTYFGTGGARASAVAVDSSNNIYIEGDAVLSTGITAMNPVPGFFACSTPNASSGFISEINAAGSLAFSSCVAGASPTIVLDASGNISIAGAATTGFPLHNPIQSNVSTQGDAYVATVNPSTGTLVFSSFLGDGLGGTPTINDIAIDPSGNLYAAGYGNNFPIFNALQPGPAAGDPPCPVMNPCGPGTNVDILKIAPTDAPAAALSPAILAFPAQAVGTPSAPQTATVVDRAAPRSPSPTLPRRATSRSRMVAPLP
jgi:Beta-propeller repeat